MILAQFIGGILCLMKKGLLCLSNSVQRRTVGDVERKDASQYPYLFD
jgi:hypothetical protein